MKILGESVEYADDYMDIDALKFLKDNPRVYAVTHGEVGFDQKPQEEQQTTIFEKLQNEPKREESPSGSRAPRWIDRTRLGAGGYQGSD